MNIDVFLMYLPTRLCFHGMS